MLKLTDSMKFFLSNSIAGKAILIIGGLLVVKNTIDKSKKEMEMIEKYTIVKD